MSDGHKSDCATHNAPALPKGECDCGYKPPQTEKCIHGIPGGKECLPCSQEYYGGVIKLSNQVIHETHGPDADNCPLCQKAKPPPAVKREPAEGATD